MEKDEKPYLQLGPFSEIAEKSYLQLEPFAEIAEKLTTNPTITSATITINLNSTDFITILSEIEQFVKVKINRNQTKVSLDINNVEFIFIKN